MDIPLVNTAPARAPGIVTPIAPAQVQATVQAQTAALLVAQTTVDLSPLGRFLSAVALFQKRMLELQSNPAAAAAEQASEQGISPLALAVADLAASANALQASSITGTSDDQSLSTLFGQQFAAQAAPDDDADDTGLPAIGLTFGSASSFDDGDVLTVDTAVLQAAFATDPAGTTELLSRTATAFGALAGIAPADGAEPSLLVNDEPAPFGPQTQPEAQTTGQQQVPPNFSIQAAPLSSDAAFFQELLADTPRPALALEQAAPPEVAEAIANFEASRVAESDQGQAERQLDTAAAPLQPNLPQGQDVDTAIAVNSERSTTSQTQQAAAAQLERGQADQSREAQDATRDANLRMGDAIAAERAANERIANAMSAERAVLAAERNTQATDEAILARAAEESVEQTRLARDAELVRLDRARDARAPGLDELAPPPLRDTAATLAPVQTMSAGEPGDVVIPRLPPLNAQPLNNAQQLARDPAIAAAIAAYNLSAGPFAALNGRTEQATPRPKVIPPVDSVTKVAAIETDAATSESSRPFR